jgi:hypothetical protein
LKVLIVLVGYPNPVRANMASFASPLNVSFTPLATDSPPLGVGSPGGGVLEPFSSDPPILE